MRFGEYNPQTIEKKWQQIWDEKEAFKASDDRTKKKFYALIEFPYPSGNGLHVGHPRSNTALDIISRKRRMEGFNVLYPMGWDAFGLPTENFAIKNKVHPQIVTQQNIDNFRKQLKSIGFSFDWSREVDTTDPKYFKWTQWIFLKLFEKGLAYKSEMPINWCTSCKVGLANEEVVSGVCERCGSDVVQKVKSQWMLKITDYAEKLIGGLDTIDFLDKVKAQQRNWIGRSEGAEVDFTIDGEDKLIRVFTTRPDTLFGATYMVLSPEHPYVGALKEKIKNWDEVAKYCEEATKKSEFDRAEMNKVKTGVSLNGINAINPVNGKKIPIWISDYVLMTYGTGAIMAVPAHDSRDHEFAKEFKLPIIEVVAGSADVQETAFTDIDDGVMVNSDFLNDLSVTDAKKKIVEWLSEKKLGHQKVNYKLRDWVFSRQRYWGEPIPLVKCDCCGWVPLPVEELPLLLPEVDNFMPTDTGESPLANIPEWTNTTCPKCKGPAKRETDTMPQWAGSSWYFLRYCDPQNENEFASQEALDYWMPVDWYNGGMEHTTLHLLYSRFWHKFLYDIGCVSMPEPYQKRTSHGMILGENNEKMSKSRGNVINPDEIVNSLGADTFRTYEMFMGAFDQPIPWSQNGVAGCRRFIDRVWRLQDITTQEKAFSKDLEVLMNQTIKKVSLDFESMKFNTAIAQMMTLVNAFYEKGSVTSGEFKTLIHLMNPVAPHVTEEMWVLNGFGKMLHETPWPTWDESKVIEDFIEIAVQINGKVKGKITIPRDADAEVAKEALRANQALMAQLDSVQVLKEIYVPGRIYNIVVKN